MSSTRAYFRAIRGPVLLTTAGVLLAVDHFGSQPFWRTWPVLLVVLGVMILLERSVPAAEAEGGGQLS